MASHVILARTWGWSSWGWLVVPLTVYCLTCLALFAFGRTDDPNPLTFFFRQISDSLERATGYPGWSMAGVLSGLLFLLIAVIGFYWDVAWHIDNGRDVQLFTPSHVMILVGLAGLLHAAAVSVLFASLDGADVGMRAGPVRIPRSSVLLFALGAGSVAAFPLDNLWHEAYGVDVTLWSPTHLQLVGGASLATLALLLMTAEAEPSARPNLLGRAIQVLTAGTVLVGLSTVQAEFDFGVPQFQLVYLPLLLVAAAGFTLLLVRVALGPWGAVKVVLVTLALRVMLALVVGGALHHTTPRFPLYLPSALVVEAVAWRLGTANRLRLALVAGALIGTLGLAGELAWVGLSGWAPDQRAVLLWRIALLAPPAALAAAVLGVGAARSFGAERDPLPLAALAAAGAVLVGSLAFPLPRRVGHVAAVVRLQPVADRAYVAVELDPPDAAHRASAFAVTSWQGGGRVTALLDEIGPGRYRTSKPVPVTGRWKSLVTLERGDQVMAVPVYLPADPAIGAPAVPAVPERRAAFVRNTTWLLRESHGGPAWPAVVAYAGLGALVALWVALIAFAGAASATGLPLSRTGRGQPGGPAPAVSDRRLEVAAG